MKQLPITHHPAWMMTPAIFTNITWMRKPARYLWLNADLYRWWEHRAEVSR